MDRSKGKSSESLLWQNNLHQQTIMGQSNKKMQQNLLTQRLQTE